MKENGGETKEEDLGEWLAASVLPKLVDSSIKSVTVALMTPQDFKESWELPLSVCIMLDNDENVTYKKLAYEGRSMKDGSTMQPEEAVAHLIAPTSDGANEDCCLYLWPGDQSQGFHGYPTQTPLQGPFHRDRLQNVFLRLGLLLIKRQNASTAKETTDAEKPMSSAKRRLDDDNSSLPEQSKLAKREWPVDSPSDP